MCKKPMVSKHIVVFNTTMPAFIIEHLEPKMWPWCIIEYRHISKIVGKNNLIITNTKPCKALKNCAKLIKSSVSELKLKIAQIRERIDELIKEIER